MLKNLNLAMLSQAIKSKVCIAWPSKNQKPEIGTTKLSKPPGIVLLLRIELNLHAKFRKTKPTEPNQKVTQLSRPKLDNFIFVS